MNLEEGRKWLMSHPMHQALMGDIWQVRYNNYKARFEIHEEFGWVIWAYPIDDLEIEPMVRAMPDLPAGDNWVQLGDVPGIAIKGGGIMSGCRNAGELKALRADRQRLNALITEYETRSAEAELTRRQTG